MKKTNISIEQKKNGAKKMDNSHLIQRLKKVKDEIEDLIKKLEGEEKTESYRGREKLDEYYSYRNITETYSY